MKHLIISVEKGSPAYRAGMRQGDFLVTLCGTDVCDVIDYEQLSCTETLDVTYERDGILHDVVIEKDEYEPLGLEFESSLMSPIRQCKNHCIFCFIDQMHTGGRKTLHFKDDDWRLSLIMGNYVTLTNVDDAEFERIIKRRVSPLYISVHATDGEVRKLMMRNPTAVRIKERLQRLHDENLKFHCQIVLCPNINDKDILRQTIEDLYSYTPAAQSVAVVPVGLTKFREGLYPLRCLTKEEANDTIDMIEAYQKRFLDECGSRFVFASDEMYIMAGRELPPEEAFEDYPQIENGVGLLRKFEYELCEELSYAEDDIKALMQGRTVRIDGVTGMSAYGFLCKLFEKLKKYGIEIVLHPIRNDFFGSTITVAGLLTATDIMAQMKDESIGCLIMPHNMVRENTTVFLDGKSVDDIKEKLNCRAHILHSYDGAVFLHELTDIIGEGLL